MILWAINFHDSASFDDLVGVDDDYEDVNDDLLREELVGLIEESVEEEAKEEWNDRVGFNSTLQNFLRDTELPSLAHFSRLQTLNHFVDEGDEEDEDQLEEMDELDLPTHGMGCSCEGTGCGSRGGTCTCSLGDCPALDPLHALQGFGLRFHDVFMNRVIDGAFSNPLMMNRFQLERLRESMGNRFNTMFHVHAFDRSADDEFVGLELDRAQSVGALEEDLLESNLRYELHPFQTHSFLTHTTWWIKLSGKLACGNIRSSKTKKGIESYNWFVKTFDYSFDPNQLALCIAQWARNKDFFDTGLEAIDGFADSLLVNPSEASKFFNIRQTFIFVYFRYLIFASQELIASSPLRGKEKTSFRDLCLQNKYLETLCNRNCEFARATFLAYFTAVEELVNSGDEIKLKTLINRGCCFFATFLQTRHAEFVSLFISSGAFRIVDSWILNAKFCNWPESFKIWRVVLEFKSFNLGLGFDPDFVFKHLQLLLNFQEKDSACESIELIRLLAVSNPPTQYLLVRQVIASVAKKIMCIISDMPFVSPSFAALSNADLLQIYIKLLVTHRDWFIPFFLSQKPDYWDETSTAVAQLEGKLRLTLAMEDDSISKESEDQECLQLFRQSGMKRIRPNQPLLKRPVSDLLNERSGLELLAMIVRAVASFSVDKKNQSFLAGLSKSFATFLFTFVSDANYIDYFIIHKEDLFNILDVIVDSRWFETRQVEAFFVFAAKFKFIPDFKETVVEMLLKHLRKAVAEFALLKENACNLYLNLSFGRAVYFLYALMKSTKVNFELSWKRVLINVPNLNSVWMRLNSYFVDLANFFSVQVMQNDLGGDFDIFVSPGLPVSDFPLQLRCLPLFHAYVFINCFYPSQDVDVEGSNSSADFVAFLDAHKTSLKHLCYHLPSTLSTSTGFIKMLMVAGHSVLDFESKKKYFYTDLHQRFRTLSTHSVIVVSRSNLFNDSLDQLMRLSSTRIRSKLRISFRGEEGYDAGGLVREWFFLLSKEILNRDYALFSASFEVNVFQPNVNSDVNEYHLQYFKFVGRFLAKAIYDSQLIEACFTRPFYKHILGLKIDFDDISSIDASLHKSLSWMKHNSVENIIFNTFSVEIDRFGEKIVHDLKSNGRNIPVNDENKLEYIKLVTDFFSTSYIKKQIDAILEGFYDLIPADLIKIFTPKELEVLLCGVGVIDLEDMRRHTRYPNGSEKSVVVRWFWKALHEFSPENRSNFLQFVTGSSRVPPGGFSDLQGPQGPCRFAINITQQSDDAYLPIAHTCFNQIDLPRYSSFSLLKQKLHYALTHCQTGFAIH